MPSKSEPPNEPEQQPPDLFSSIDTRAMLEEFRELVRAGILRVTAENEVLSVKEPGGEKPIAPSPAREEDVAKLDRQLLEWLERKRQQKAAESRRKEPEKAGPGGEELAANIRRRVIERVAQKILETWDRVDQTSGPHESLREQVVERVAEDILRRWQRNLE